MKKLIGICAVLMLLLVIAQCFIIDVHAVPITDEWFGTMTVGSTLTTVGTANRRWDATQFLLISNNVNVTSISVYLNASGTDAEAEAAVYNGTYQPVVTSTYQNITTEGWYDFPIVSTVLLSAGMYYLALYAHATSYAGHEITFRSTVAVGVGYYKNAPSAWPTWPDPVAAPVSFSHTLSIYANYTYELETPIAAATPKTIGVVNTPWAIRYQPKAFWGASRYWVFYVNMTYDYSSAVYGSNNVTDAYYTSTLDEGDTWETPVDLGLVCEPAGENVQVLWNGTEVTLILRKGSALWTRMGTPEINGTITWLEPWSVFPTWQSTGSSNADFFACLDSNGLPWISWEISAVGVNPKLWVNHADSTYLHWNATDGQYITWSVAPGFPMIVDNTANWFNSFIIPLLGGQVYVIYWTGATSGSNIYGKLWNGTDWEARQTISTKTAYSQYSPGYETWTRGVEVDTYGNIYYVFLDSNRDLDYVKWDNATETWGATETVDSNVVPFVSPSLSLYGDILYLFYAADQNGISYRTMSLGSWSGRALFLDESVDKIPAVSPEYWNGVLGTDPGGYDGRINPFTQVTGTNFAILYLTNSTTANYYKMKLLIIEASTLPIQPGDCFYNFYGLLSESTGAYTGPVNLTGIWSDIASPMTNYTLEVNGSKLWQINVHYQPDYFYYDLTDTLSRYIYLKAGERNGTFYLYNGTNLRNVTFIFQGDYTPYDYVQIKKTSYVLSQINLTTDRVSCVVSFGTSYAVTLTDGTNYTFHNVAITDYTIYLIIGTEGDPVSANTFYIPPMYLFVGKVGDILASFGVVAMMVSRVHTMKEGLRAFVITLIVAMVFFGIWFLMTSLEAYA